MKKGLVEIVSIIDRSGSMSSVKSDAIGGFNQFLQDQKELPGEALFTLVQFDDQYEVIHNGEKIQNVKPLDDKTYVPRGTTALLDAIGKTIVTVGERLDKTDENDKPEKVIVSILTDGAENASSEYTRERISDMIKLQTDDYSWEFIFLAANQDAFATAGGLSINAKNTMHFMDTGEGTRTAFKSINTMVSNNRTIN
jgi:uncharacterized protein YegL